MVNRKQFKPKLEGLVRLFESNKEFYKSKDYKEDHLRQEFLNPFFKALGWDMDNEQHFAPQYREVIHEDRIEIEGKPKAPDYSFRIGNERKFFVEAKAAFVNVEKEIAPSFQLRRYSWSGKLPLSVLSDFEEFSIYDTTIEPKPTDKADIARIKYLQFQNYPDELDYLWDTFSKEAVWSGSFDKFTKKERRGNELVDKAFLKDIEQWRNLLAKDIAINNSRLDIIQLNEAVQKIIDRIIFLRIAEDRGIEKYETLKDIIKYQNSYPYLVKLFFKAQEKYNSNLFDFKADVLTSKLKISDRILDRIIGTLYFPKSPYEFSVIGVEILGSVYEQFLGKVIRLTRGHNAVIEEKPEVKKAGGVYYTPKYIVDYIVKNTVGELVKRKTPKEVSKLRIVDPACGSGSFLLGAYTFLLDWHLKYYTNNDPAKYVRSKALFRDNEGSYLLSTAEKKRILLNNIYGVDIDAQAVEVSKLSLALKMLENENSETINAQLRLFSERILPDLGSNIKCGNSLIGSDYYEGKLISTISDEEIRRINAFDWEKEFAEVFRKSVSGGKQGGFDAVIGNPPYIRIQNLQTYSPESVNFIKSHYITANKGGIDLYVAFIEKGMKLLSDKGLLSFITPHKFFTANMGTDLRKLLISRKSIKKIVSFGTNQIFENATTYTAIFVLSRSKNSNIQYHQYKLQTNYQNLSEVTFDLISSNSLSETPWIFSEGNVIYILKKLRENSTNLESLSDKVFKGSSTGNDNLFIVQLLCELDNKTVKVKNKFREEFNVERSVLKSFVNGENIRRYFIEFSERYLIYPYDDSANLIKYSEFQNKYPLATKYLVSNSRLLKQRRIETNDSNFYKYSAARSLIQYNQPKILVPDILVSSRFALDEKGEVFHGPAIHSIVLTKNIRINFFQLLGILNSKIFWFYIANTSTALRGNAYRLTPMYISSFPVKLFTEINKAIYLKIEKLVKDSIHAQKQLHFKSISENQKKFWEQKVQNLDKNIDQLVYQLYGLTKEEIEIVERSVK